jgi:hypothetical protein
LELKNTNEEVLPYVKDLRRTKIPLKTMCKKYEKWPNLFPKL